LRTAREQRDVTVEVIVVDDGSKVPVALDAPAPHVRVLRLEGPGAVARARNRGIAAATGEWIAFLDDDDLWAPGRLAKLVALGELEGADIVVGGTIALDAVGNGLRLDPVPDPLTLREDLYAYNVFGGPSSVMARRSALEDVGGFDEAFSVLADWELWIRLAASRRVAVHPEALTGYTIHAESMHVQRTELAIHEFRVLAERHGPAQERRREVEFIRWAASAHRRAGRRREAMRVYWRNWRRYREWSDLVRALVAPLGETAMKRASRRAGVPVPDTPSWVTAYFNSSSDSESDGDVAMPLR
jgi:glycosyltransferase involved in cell wall biosynthesis